MGDWSALVDGVCLGLLGLITIGHTRALTKIHRRASNLESGQKVHWRGGRQ